MTQDDKDKPTPEPPRFSPAELKLFDIGGRLAMALVIVGSIATFALLAWFVWQLIKKNVPIQ